MTRTMSVRVNERGENVSTVFTKASALLAFSIRAVSSIKNGTVCRLKMKDETGIPKRYIDWIATPIVELARDIMHGIYCAEKERDFSRQMEYLNQVEKSMNCLQSEITMCFLEFDLKMKKAREWNALFDSLKDTFKNWSNGLKK